MNARLTKLWWFVNDRVYPRLRRFSATESERERALAQTEQEQYLAQIAGLPDDEHVLAEQLEACVKLLDEEEAARRGVEARLTSIVGLSSIAGTIVFSGILALATGTLRADTIVLRSVMALGALYLALQICWAILASVRGLERRPYIAQNPSVILPLPNEVRPVYLRRQIRMCAARLADDRLQNNEKVNQMALAHCATKNFLGGLVALAVLGTCFAMTVKNPSEDLIQTLRKNHDLNELLRGPQGPKGDPGPPGSPGQELRKQLLNPTKRR